MTDKARKHIGLGALVMAIAVVGALAAIIVLADGPGAALAHEPGNRAAHTAVCPSQAHDNAAAAFNEPTCAQELGTTAPTPAPTTPTPTTPTPTTAPSGGSTVDLGRELPGMVENLKVESHNVEHGGVPEEQLVVTWSPPAENDGGSVDSYRIDISEDGKRWTSYVPNHRDSELRLEHSDLESQTTMHFRVFAVNGRGTGPGSDASGATIKSTTPDRPELLSAVASSQTTIDLMWDAPLEEPPGAPITGYKIEVSENGRTSWRELDTTPAGVTTHSHTGLLANTTRYYRVFAENKYGFSTVSDSDSATTTASVAPGPLTKPVIGLSPRGYDVHLTWGEPADPAGDPVTHYIVEARAGANNYAKVHSGEFIDRTKTYNFGGEDINGKGGINLPPLNLIPGGGVPVDIRIQAVNNAGKSPWLHLRGIPVGHEGAPKKPDKPVVRPDQDMHEGRSGLNVTWNTAEFIDAGMPAAGSFNNAVSYILVVDGVELAAGPITHGRALPAGGNLSRPGYDDDMLATETGKTYYVYAMNRAVVVTGASVRSFPSDDEAGTTNRPLRPDAPIDLDVQDSGHTEIDLTWAHASDGDMAGACMSDSDGSECGVPVITGYRIEISDNGETGWTVLEDMHAMQTYTATELNPGERYFFRISAHNSRYTSNPTPANSAETTDPGAPTPPGGLVAQAEGADSIKLCWFEQNVVQGGADTDERLPVLGYKITRTGPDGEVVVEPDTGNDETQYTDDNDGMGLMAETTYTYTVQSITLGGIGTAAEASAITEEQTNTAPTASDIPAVSVMEGASSDAMDLSMYFTDADDDTLTYTVTSSDDSTATASESGGMLTVMGVANGMGAADAMATITVMADDGNGGTATATIAVTVTVSDAIGEPDITSATVGDGSISVSWTDGDNAVASLVLLMDGTFQMVDMDEAPVGNTSTFTGLATDTYTVVVVSIHANGKYAYKTETKAVP